MPTTLLDYEHELIADGAATGLLFGKTDRTRSPYWTLEYPQVSGGDDTYGDVAKEREDGIDFGEDYLGAKTVTFELEVDTMNAANPHLANEDAIERLQAAWENPAYRNQSGKVAVLRSRAVPGRVRRAYGRPRRFAPTTSRLTHKGLSSAVCDFVVGDAKWYDDVEQSITRAPAWATAALNVTGTRPTWPVITFTGPTLGPLLQLGDWGVGLNGILGIGQSVTIDPRPWVRTVLRDDGANMAGYLTSGSPPLRKCYLNPGGHNLMYIASAGTGTVTVRWRPAYSRW